MTARSGAHQLLPDTPAPAQVVGCDPAARSPARSDPRRNRQPRTFAATPPDRQPDPVNHTLSTCSPTALPSPGRLGIFNSVPFARSARNQRFQRRERGYSFLHVGAHDRRIAPDLGVPESGAMLRQGVDPRFRTTVVPSVGRSPVPPVARSGYRAASACIDLDGPVTCCAPRRDAREKRTREQHEPREHDQLLSAVRAGRRE